MALLHKILLLIVGAPLIVIGAAVSLAAILAFIVLAAVVMTVAGAAMLTMALGTYLVDDDDARWNTAVKMMIGPRGRS
jgi:hypothetical protein